MSSTKKPYNGPYKGDAGYIAEELLEGRSALDSKCLVIEKTVEDGDFSLEEALQLYEVSQEEYENFLVRRFFGEFEITLTALSSLSAIAPTTTQQHKTRFLRSVELLEKAYKKFISPVDMESGIVIRHLEDLSRKIQTGQTR